MEPLKAEIINLDENGGTSGAPDERSTPTKPPSTTLDRGSAISAAKQTLEKKTSERKCPECQDTFESSAHLLKHLQERHKRKRSRLKASELLKTLNPSEVIQSSGSECDYEVTFNVKRIPKRLKPDGTVTESEKSTPTAPVVATPTSSAPHQPPRAIVYPKISTPSTSTSFAITASTPVTLASPTKPISNPNENETVPSSVILITVPPPDEPTQPQHPHLEPMTSTPIRTDDDLEDMLTSSLIMKPKIIETESRPMRRRNENAKVQKKNSQSEPTFTGNIMIASINSDGQIVEQCVEAIEAEGDDDIIEEDYGEMVEEALDPSPTTSTPVVRHTTIRNPGGRSPKTSLKPPPPKPPVQKLGRPRMVRPQIIPAEKLKEMKEKELAQKQAATVASNAAASEIDSDEEAGDGAIRKCLECKMCKWMFLSTKKAKKHLADVHRLSLIDSDLTKYTKAYPYKNIKPTNGVRAFACSVCLRMYSNVNALKKHQIIQHSSALGLDDKPPGDNKAPLPNTNIHVCHVCKKSFLDPENLRSHLLLHVDGKIDDSNVYKCDQCGLGFEYEAALTKHTIENHATLRLYSCEYCNDAFASSADLFEHVQEHVSKNDQPTNTTNEGSNISELYLACPEDDCELAFKDSNSYYWHILYEHRKVYQDDPKFIEFLNLVDPDTLTQEEPVAAETTQPEVEPEAAVVAAAEQVEAHEKKTAMTTPAASASTATATSNAPYADSSLRFTCRLCDRKVSQLNFHQSIEKFINEFFFFSSHTYRS